MLWEVTFPVFVLLKRTRVYCISFGIVIHLGIYVFMMINAFEILFISTYGFFFTDAELHNLWNYVKRKIGNRVPFRLMYGRNTQKDRAGV